MTRYEPHDALASALRGVAEEDAHAGASPAVEGRLLQEVRAIARARRIAAVKVYAVAAVLVLAVGGAVWSARGSGADSVAATPDFRSPFPAPRSPEETTEFFALHYSNVPATDVRLVRLEVPRRALASFGLESAEPALNGAASTVLAEVVIGGDGLARAIRFVGVGNP